MSHRVGNLISQMRAPELQTCSAPGTKNPNDVVIIRSVRTPQCKAKRGGFRDATALDLLVPVLKAAAEGVDPSLIDDVVCGNVLGKATKATEVRMASFLAGFPESTSVRTVNRQCSSGLQAIADIASAITAGYIDCGIGAGVENMTHDTMGGGGMPAFPQAVMDNENARNCLTPMGITSENVAKQFGISRTRQDELAVVSNARAAAASEAGRFKDEIVPITVTQKDPKTGALTSVTIAADDGIRKGTSVEGLAKLRPAFSRKGSTTAGNSSQVSDGASATLLMRRSKAQELGLPIQGVIRSFAVAGVPPAIMGIGPAYAIPKALAQAGLSTEDIDLYEINEAFASQAVYCVEKLGLNWDKVNVNGGALAIGHPLGSTGARMTATLLAEMKKRHVRFGVVSMCIGTGMGAAAVYEVEN